MGSGCLYHVHVVGVLLHGPSGCGKTMLAMSLISHPQFNHLVITASELYSRYLGRISSICVVRSSHMWYHVMWCAVMSCHVM